MTALDDIVVLDLTNTFSSSRLPHFGGFWWQYSSLLELLPGALSRNPRMAAGTTKLT